LTELSSTQKTVTDEDVSITRQYLPILKKHLFLYGKVNEVYAATSYEFMVEATYSPENHMRLFINEMDMYLYSSARFIKQGIGFKEVAEKLKIYGDKVAKKHNESTNQHLFLAYSLQPRRRHPEISSKWNR